MSSLPSVIISSDVLVVVLLLLLFWVARVTLALTIDVDKGIKREGNGIRILGCYIILNGRRIYVHSESLVEFKSNAFLNSSNTIGLSITICPHI